MLTLRDVVRGHLAPSGGTVALAAGLSLPELERQVTTLDGATLQRLTADDGNVAADGVLVVALTDESADVVERLMTTTNATTAFLLLGAPVSDATLWPRALGIAGTADCQVLAAVPVQGTWPLVIVLSKGQPLAVPAAHLGAGAQVTPTDERQLALRTANELTLVSLVNDALLARVERAAREAREHQQLERRLRAEVTEARKRADGLARRLGQVESSRSFRLVSAVASLRSRARALGR